MFHFTANGKETAFLIFEEGSGRVLQLCNESVLFHRFVVLQSSTLHSMDNATAFK